MTRSDRLRYAFKNIVAHGLYYLGVLQLLQAVTLRKKAVVLMYHRVLTADESRQTASHPALIVERDTFERQMTLLKRRFAVLSIDEFAERLQQDRPLPPSACVVTFDDGWKDNFSNALPILRAHNLPSLVFLPFDYIGNGCLFWQETLVHLLIRVVNETRRDPSRRDEFKALLDDVGLAWLLESEQRDLRLPIIEAVSAQKQLGRERIDALAGTLATKLGVRLDQLSTVDGFIDWSQVEEMRRHGVSFGGHGVKHHLLTMVSGACADDEIRGSKEALERSLKPTVATFSYPNGYHTSEIAAKVKEVGYALAFVAQGGPVERGDDRWTLKRVNIHQTVTDTGPLFLARLVGLF
jgi:peptidoglycan/xylan/chitin deacetylase (PgdA/CDA1 family)